MHAMTRVVIVSSDFALERNYPDVYAAACRMGLMLPDYGRHLASNAHDVVVTRDYIAVVTPRPHWYYLHARDAIVNHRTIPHELWSVDDQIHPIEHCAVIGGTVIALSTAMTRRQRRWYAAGYSRGRVVAWVYAPRVGSQTCIDVTGAIPRSMRMTWARRVNSYRTEMMYRGEDTTTYCTLMSTSGHMVGEPPCTRMHRRSRVRTRTHPRAVLWAPEYRTISIVRFNATTWYAGTFIA